ncbi:unnamed protein product [Calicophoron daubneyi]|uniref:Golgi apparatus membrane protein TVP23 homolog n=1 Tax=Calicophoron daubneyi TaxID=300641 RepID=A0AAV2TZ66_CALDB
MLQRCEFTDSILVLTPVDEPTMNPRDEVVLALTDDIDAVEATGGGSFSSSSKRIALTGHFVFKATAILVYLFCAWFTSSFVVPFVFVLISLALDFWFVKNISGRILVGLRWSSYTDENGHTHWRFDSRPAAPEPSGGVQLSRRELAARAAATNAARLFWIGLIGTPLVWSVFLLAAVFSLQFRWGLVAAMGVGMSAANLYGFSRCRLSDLSEGTSNVLSGIQSKLTRQVFKDLWSNMTRRSNPPSKADHSPSASVPIDA